MVAGGSNSSGKFTDIVEIYDSRENSWKLFEIGLSSPRAFVSMVSSQKDRVIIIGGQDKDGLEVEIVEEIDFLKRNCVTLSSMETKRAKCNSFLVNDQILLFGGTSTAEFDKGQFMGEKNILSENKWRGIAFPDQRKQKTFLAPAALIYA